MTATPPTLPTEDTDVVIVGAGPTGLTLACELARRGLKFRILERSAVPFNGSRGKGIQPRTLEVFDGLGAIEPLLRAGARYPMMRMHLRFAWWSWHMMKPQKKTPDVPYPDTWMVAQANTEKVLRDRLAELGHAVDFGCEVTELQQDAHGVALRVMQGGTTRSLRARYVVGADGGKSFVRKTLGLEFAGSTSQEGRMIVGDLHVEGLARTHWHIWPTPHGTVGLCPMPHSDLFQIMMRLDPADADPELSEAAIQQRWAAIPGTKKIRLHSPTWLSIFRPNVRLVERYRSGRVFLAGDAAHVHTPAGAQGLNTGVQDAWNLGWKLALVLRDAPERLLDTYEEERRPVAEYVLELSNALFQSTKASVNKLRRGDKERQLLLHYRGRSLSVDLDTARQGLLQAGDRAPDAPGARPAGGTARVFDALRGGHFTALAFGPAAIAALQGLRARPELLQVVPVIARGVAGDARALVDDKGEIRRIYGVAAGENLVLLVRPDGYIGQVAIAHWREAVEGYLADVAGVRALADAPAPQFAMAAA